MIVYVDPANINRMLQGELTECLGFSSDHICQYYNQAITIPIKRSLIHGSNNDDYRYKKFKGMVDKHESVVCAEILQNFKRPKDDVYLVTREDIIE